MKWEKRIETAFTHFAGWFFDSRGWGICRSIPPSTGRRRTRLTTRFRVGTQIYSTGRRKNPTGGAATSGYGW